MLSYEVMFVPSDSSIRLLSNCMPLPTSLQTILVGNTLIRPDNYRLSERPQTYLRFTCSFNVCKKLWALHVNLPRIYDVRIYHPA